jgi:hypothetical protein
MTYGVVRAFQVIVNTFPEKAGVGDFRSSHKGTYWVSPESIFWWYSSTASFHS